jgi:hypothetical protein
MLFIRMFEYYFQGKGALNICKRVNYQSWEVLEFILSTA